MKKIIHISDLHFGTEEVITGEALLNDIDSLDPDLVIISGDLTQRARRRQFEHAAAFLDRIEFPKIVVPGNHDIPLFDIFTRFVSPLERYKKYITDDLFPVYEDDEMAVMGINTSRNYVWKSGSISDEQIEKVIEFFSGRSFDVFKILVAHHPFIPPPDDPSEKLVKNSTKALAEMNKCGLDLMLSGHLHKGYSGTLEAYYPDFERAMIAAQAGTAISRRRRGEMNSYNYIILDGDTLTIEVRNFISGEFRSSDSKSFHFENDQRIWKVL
jgi:3',5'-cyclic AMP phosphodiesterase CpdA